MYINVCFLLNKFITNKFVIIFNCTKFCIEVTKVIILNVTNLCFSLSLFLSHKYYKINKCWSINIYCICYTRNAQAAQDTHFFILPITNNILHLNVTCSNTLYTFIRYSLKQRPRREIISCPCCYLSLITMKNLQQY